MNGAKDSDLRARYLSNASQYLLAASPSTSACVMAERLELMENMNVAPDQLKSPAICLACGIKLLPGLTSRAIVRSKREAVKQADDKQSNIRRRAMPLVSHWQEECLNCGRITGTALAKTTRSEITKRINPSRQATRPLRQMNSGHGIETSTQTSNKKRKKNQGLLSRLKEEEERANSSPEFNLMDFMKAV